MSETRYPMHPKVAAYLGEGCTRCELQATPACKVHGWAPVLYALREVVLSTGLTEAFKWSQPCYTAAGRNVCVVSAFKHYAVITFFQGALLDDPAGLLVAPGENSRTMRQFRVTTEAEVEADRDGLRALIEAAAADARAGRKVKLAPQQEPVPEELTSAFRQNPALEDAFYGLTPGRQREYLLHFCGAKRASTRESRVARYTPLILAGEGMNDGYRKK